jgi:anti-sigma factor RsiW
MTPPDVGHEPPSRVDCEAAARALYDFLDGRLPDASMQAVRRHVEMCACCAGHYHFARRVLELIPSAMPLDGESRDLRLKVIETLKAEGYVSPG